ncbi:MAG: serine protease [Verrucomicrobia bacterium CG_4_10_14_3_um_filter_43_23]|nr:MAG: hypothetical protein AUJ82_04700 [Verrucomicrobia bacterium CG1_02_43_26]PIP59007.1 MAG: serine protease [Verrucomicrobia bacterium CG22_combo_CG10-13_8_21_14_all_43_17]PIX59105.1 MAG: serine protease [Verrucomicrobia bacterium CG_4_10_14_3_um_filter_43_23]PIY61373.1 MAG: serine protease [Verrucomicrobia bacterium CG_4_10_14_0_8_um_filter_43_34]PJA44155.1 MAG: serine protease [Verrucomicrobia bacterium CG_4_9_14_3_um_filter_43_20]
MTIIITLILIGLMLIIFEIIVPGGVLGFLGGAALLGACVYTYLDYGLTNAIGVFVFNLAMSVVAIAFALKFLPKTKIGQRMFLNKAVDDKSTAAQGTDELIGKTGETLTTLAPTGMISIEGQQYEGFSQDGLIPKGNPIIVSGRDNFRIIVRKHQP